MRTKIACSALLTLVSMNSTAQLKYPPTAKTDTIDHYNGVAIPDPYRWLEDDRSDATAAWVKEQNEVTFGYLSQIPFRDAWKQRMLNVMNYEKYSAPFKKAGYYYFYKNSGLQNQSSLYRQKGLDGQPELVIDPNTLAADGTSRLAGFSLSKNGTLAAYAVSAGGSDWMTVHVRDMQTGKDLQDKLEWVKVSGLSWQGNGFYYSRYPTPGGSSELSSKNENHMVYYHEAGTDQSQDKLVYSDPANPQRFHFVGTSDDERFLILNISDRGKGLMGNALYYRDLQQKDTAWVPLVKEVGQYNYSWLDNFGDSILIQTNDQAPNYKIMAVMANQPGQPWKELIPEGKFPISSTGTGGGNIFVNYLQDVSTHVYQYTDKGKLIREVKLPGIGTASGFGAEQGEKDFFYTFTSFNYPSTIFRYDIAGGKSTLFRAPVIPSFKPDAYETKQVFYTSKDGTKVPMFITAKKGVKLDGNNPVLLYAYGGFNISLTPSFSTGVVTWLEQGGVYAVANLRGGAEYGEKWHQAGMLEKKQNVFDDFIAAGEWLVKEKYTRPGRLAIQGGSNGGLLVGTVINQRPDLFGVAIPQVGVMDMLRFQKFTIGWNWIAEYGSSEKPDQFKFLYAYSPLHNIRPDLHYPAVLVTTADHDDRVVPAHSFKYIAALQEAYKGPNPVLVRIDTNSGHGASNLTKSIETSADIMSFIFYNMKLTPDFKSVEGGVRKGF